MSHKKNRNAAFNIIVDDFCKRRGLDRKGIPAGLESSIYAVSAPLFLFIESMDEIGLDHSDDPVDGLLVSLINRIFNAVTGSLALIATGHLQESEALARTVMESALTMLYVGDKNTGERFIQYFISYLKAEKKQNRNWERSLSECGERTRNEHQQRIRNKDDVLKLYEDRLNIFANIMAVPYPPDENWPEVVYQRFSKLGRELDYRTVYTAMCSQSHHDAEDILNRLIIDSITEVEGFSERLSREKHSFSLFLVMFAIKYYLEATILLAIRYKLKHVEAVTGNSLDMVARELEVIGKNLESGGFPSHWQGRLID